MAANMVRFVKAVRDAVADALEAEGCKDEAILTTVRELEAGDILERALDDMEERGGSI